MRRRAPVALAALCLGLSACGSGSGRSNVHPHHPDTAYRPRPVTSVDVYSSLPLHGPHSTEGKAIESGINLALWEARDHTGFLNVSYTPLDDATAASHGWSEEKTLANAMQAARDPNAVFYIGEFDSGASEFSIPILNQAGIAQVSPGSGYIGLTAQVPSVRDATLGAQANVQKEPDRYYPAGLDTRNFVRLIPSDVVQAAADADAMKTSLGCRRVALASDNTRYGISLAALIGASAPKFGLAVGAPTQIDPNRTEFRNYVERLRLHGIDCLAYAGAAVSTAAVDLVREVHLLDPSMHILGTAGVCSEAWTKPRVGGAPTAIDPLMYCTQPPLPVAQYHGLPFPLGNYRHLYGSHANPDPWTLYGYEAMELGLQTISQLGRNGARRASVRQTLFATTVRPSVLGTYSINGSGETSLTAYGLYKATPDGGLNFFKVLDPAPRILATS